MSELLLGIDIGTSGSRGVLAHSDGTVVARAARPHETSMPKPGWFEHDAEAVWWHDFRALTGDLLAQAGGARVAGVGVSGIGPCLLAADARLQPLRPAILYGVDTRATREIEELSTLLGPENILRRCGSPLTSQAIGPKLAWLRRQEPDLWRRTRRFLMASSFVAGRLTGEYVLDHHSASQCDPLYDLEAGSWIEDWAAEIAPGLELPRLAWPGEVVGRVTPAAAGATGIAAGTPVVAGTIDAWAEALSAGVTAPGDVMLMYGTTMFIVAVAAGALADRRLWGTRGVFPGTFTAAAGMATSGALTAWFRHLAGDLAFDDLLAEAASTPAGSGGLVTLPYFAGERTPIFDPRARGLILGLTLRHGRGHLYRSLLEATGFAVKHNLEALAEAGAAASRVVAVGGGTRGGLWVQIVSDITGLAQELPHELSGASYGDALLAAVGIGAADRASSWNRPQQQVLPNPDNRYLYDRLYGVYRELYTATSSQAHLLADLQSSPAGNGTAAEGDLKKRRS